MKLIEDKLDVVSEMKILLLDMFKEVEYNFGYDDIFKDAYRQMNEIFSLKNFVDKEIQDVDENLDNNLFKGADATDCIQEEDVGINLDSDEVGVDLAFDNNIKNVNDEHTFYTKAVDGVKEVEGLQIFECCDIPIDEENESLSQWFGKNANEVLEACEIVSLEHKQVVVSSFQKNENSMNFTPPSFRLLSQFSLSSPLNDFSQQSPSKCQHKVAPVVQSPYVNRRFVPTSRILHSELVVAMQLFSSFLDESSRW